MIIQDIIHKISDNKEVLGITLYSPAKQLDISIAENLLNITFPAELKDFYLFCNGFESEEDLFRIVPLNEMRQMDNRLSDNQIVIAEYLGYCDYWEMTIEKDGSYKISEGSFHTVLTNSFTEFLERFLTGGVFEDDGLYKWKENILNKK